jgi:hypothetical protein
MITLNSPITLNPPPYTDNSTNKVVTPEPIILNELKISYIDTPHEKSVVARIDNTPAHIYLFTGDQYDVMGDWTQAQAEAALKARLGDDIQASLQAMYPRTLEQDPNGPGSILTGMIKTLGISSSSTCSCRRHALEMNDQGPDWCEQNMETILSWLRDEAKKRGLPFIDMVGKAMVQRAINRSRKLKANLPVGEDD